MTKMALPIRRFLMMLVLLASHAAGANAALLPGFASVDAIHADMAFPLIGPPDSSAPEWQFQVHTEEVSYIGHALSKSLVAVVSPR